MKLILDTIKERSIRTFSKFFPQIFKLGNQGLVDVGRGTNNFRINPQLIPPGEILGFARIVPPASMAGYYNPSLAVGSAIDQQIRHDLASYTKTPITAKFIPPNKISISPKYYIIKKEEIYVEIRRLHNKNFFTIPISLADEFLRLALVDAKILIYNIRKNFPNLTTVFGSIDLDIDSFSSAIDERKEIEEFWKENYYKVANRKRIWIA